MNRDACCQCHEICITHTSEHLCLRRKQMDWFLWDLVSTDTPTAQTRAFESRWELDCLDTSHRGGGWREMHTHTLKNSQRMSECCCVQCLLSALANVPPACLLELHWDLWFQRCITWRTSDLTGFAALLHLCFLVSEESARTGPGIMALWPNALDFI